MATPRNARRRPAPNTTLRAVLIALLVAGIAFGVWFAVGDWRAHHTTLAFTRSGGPVPELQLTFFPEQLAFAAPSPPPALAERVLAAGESLVLGDELVPGRAVVRYRGEGVGTGFAFVELGKKLAPIALRPPRSLSGRVVTSVAVWCLGVRCVGIRPIADAEVVVMGGGEHGIDLASARTGADGAFTVTGFDGSLNALGLRVRAKGYAIAHHGLGDLGEHADEQALVVLEPAPPRRGRLRIETDLDPQGLRVLARGLPGVEAVPAADGTFTLDHMPKGVEARILVYGLPADAAAPTVRTSQKETVEVPIVRGAVVTGRVLGRELEPIANALVWVDPLAPVSTDASGRYRIEHVLPGECTVAAQWRPPVRRAAVRRGVRKVRIEPGSELHDIDIPLDG